MSGPFLPEYDIWKTRTPPEYDPPEEADDGPDPDEERDKQQDRER